MFKKFFSSDTGKKKKSTSVDDSETSNDRRKKLQRSTTIAAPEASRAGIEEDELKHSGNNAGARPKQKSNPESSSRASGKKKKKKHKDTSSSVHVDISVPLEFPCTPEHALEYHKQKPFLSSNEEWLIVELNEFECLIDGMDIIKIIAKHSKFFEIDPDELWEEFFEFMEDVPTYDEIINYDVWQEFRDKKYPC